MALCRGGFWGWGMWGDMDIENCREFIELARCLSFTEAAARLNVSQPVLSKHVAAMEQELGAPLFVRDRHSCELSEAGRVFYGTASQILSEYSRAVDKIAALVRERPVRIDGILYDPTVESVIALVAALLDRTPHPPLVYEHHENASMLALLEGGQVDLVIGREREEDVVSRDLVAVPLLRNRFCAVVTVESELAKLPCVHAQDLQGQVLLKFVDPYAAHGWRSIEEYLARHGVEVRYRSVMGRLAAYQATPVDDAVFIQSSNVRNLRFLSDSGRYAVIPFADDDALFCLDCIFRREDEGRLRFLVDTLVESRDIVVEHRARG